MIKANDAISAGRALLGTPYSQLDCINFIKRIIRTAPGGVPGYTTAGTNSLWRSHTMSAKYRDLTWKQEGIAGAQAGMMAFKRSGDDVHHVGLVTGDGTVLHSSSAKGKVVETALDSSWALLAVHRYIETGDASATVETKGEETVSYKAKVVTQSGPLNMRSLPTTASERIVQIPRGEVVAIIQEDDGWAYVRYNGRAGWVSAAYLERVDETEKVQENDLPEAASRDTTTLMREDADGCIVLLGRWRVSEA